MGAETDVGELQALAEAALAAYDLPPGSTVKPIRFTNNAVFEVAASGRRFALRIHRPGFRSVSHIRSELQFLEVLHEQLSHSATAVPRPLPSRGGDVVVERGGRYCDVLTWVDGDVLRPGRGLGPRAAFRLGEALARVHAVAQRFEPPVDFELPRWDANGLLTEASPFAPGALDQVLSHRQRLVFAEVEARTRAIFDALGRDRASFGIIHCDYILLNCHLARRGRDWRVGVIDFDDLGWGYFLYDLCPLFGNLADSAAFRVLGRAFLDGYRSVRPLPRRLEAHLPVLMAARHASMCVWIAGMRRSGAAGRAVSDQHVAIRVAEMRRCLALRL